MTRRDGLQMVEDDLMELVKQGELHGAPPLAILIQDGGVAAPVAES